ncbi:MAG: hypothetical protein ACP5KI_03120 [Brevinematia bacterium]
MYHINLEKIILGLDEEDLKHIEECKKCKELYEIMNSRVDERVLKEIDLRVRDNVMLKFREMKMMGKFNKIDNKNISFNLIKYVFSFSLIAVLVFIGFFLWIVFSNFGSTKVINISGNRVVLESRFSNTKGIEFSTSDGVFKIVIPESVGSLSFNAFLSKDVSKVIIKYGNIEYKFAASNFRLDVKDGKVFVNGEEIKVSKVVFKNILLLNDNSKVVGNLLSINDNFIIFETPEGVKNFDRKDVKKIIYR